MPARLTISLLCAGKTTNAAAYSGANRYSSDIECHASTTILPHSRRSETVAPRPLARLASKVRACARKGGIPDGPITVQVRRQGGVIRSVKVLKFSKDHPSVSCIDEVVRGAGLSPSDRPLEDFTFSK